MRDMPRIRKITTEYVDFIKKTNILIEETKRATVLALKEILKLDENTSILIYEDGSFEIGLADNNTEGNMSEEKDQSPDKIVLNGQEVTAEELERQTEAAKKQGGTRLEEVSNGNFRLHLNG